jgi:hypothetical protein
MISFRFTDELKRTEAGAAGDALGNEFKSE